MSTISIVIIALGSAATLLFVLGYIRGTRNALNSFRQPEGKELEVPQYGHWGAMAFATIASAVVIAAVGLTPLFIYAGPILVILSAAGTGYAFFLEEKISATAPTA
ncbi:hypothetical protein D3874_24930 [Oleomonas cavernae]|uniref:Uncharacterized protein n=1 Tax=Oleomonas cavernae TaxID=2320859 RepID=A0A418WIC4_9PROT|nr:hypothetical protein [Oleomonas cavernae]RJF89806.1 hypothetical protein D3874_24930 [Oleomonas cavernae]